jgi:predicted nuclease of restriction endonuclease-like RecB superfamily
MLTKDLIRFTEKDGVVTPSFVALKTPSVKSVCEQLLAVYLSAEGLSKKEITQNTSAIIKPLRSSKVAKGINKILLDSCEFDKSEDCDYIGLREELFEKSAKFYFSPDESSFDEITYGFDEAFLKNIYGDHPDFERVISCKIKTIEELIDEYNISLVQGLLLNTESLTINAETNDATVMRYFFKQIRFHQLLCTVSMTSSGYSFFIDGPAGILENSSGYGGKIANFFKSVCRTLDWKLFGTLKVGTKRHSLILNSDFILERKVLSVYYPGEFEIFRRDFEEKSECWDISCEVEPFSLDGKQIIVPDFLFTHRKTGEIIQLELFHKWHKSQILRRLEDLKSYNSFNFIMGVDTNVYKSIEDKISKKIQSKIFRFRDFPSQNLVEKTLGENYRQPAIMTLF